MPISFKRDAIVFVGLAAVLVWAKYNIVLLEVPPFGTDPCDAVGAFAFTVVILIPLISLVRAFAPHRKDAVFTVQCLHLVRSQQALVLAVLLTLAADAIALARDPSMWIIWAESRDKLGAWLGIFAAIALAGQLLTRAAQRTLPRVRRTPWKPAALAPALAILLLVVCPEWDGVSRGFPGSTTGHVLTVVLGALVALAPIRFLLPVLVPHQLDEECRDTALLRTGSEWGALLVGVLMFAFGFWAYSHRWAGVLRYMRRPVGALAAPLIAYAFLAAPLGMLRKAVDKITRQAPTQVKY